MTVTVINRETLPKELSRLFTSSKVLIHHDNNEVRLVPAPEKPGCPLLGIMINSKVTVDSMIASRQHERELEQ